MKPAVRIAINGYGRIGRCVLRALHERTLDGEHFQVVLINEPADLDTVTYLTRFDSTHGPFPGQVESHRCGLRINDQLITVTHSKNPEHVPWADHAIDMVLECSGAFNTRTELQRFVQAGCPRVLVSQPCKSAADVDFTLVCGVNDHELSGRHVLVSNASCTTNATVPLLAHLHEHYGLSAVFLTTLHSVMNDQPMIDGYHHADLRRTRSAMQSIIPVSTGLAQGIERLLPALAGRVQAKAIRVPILNVSAIDIMLRLERSADTDALNACMKAFAASSGGLVAWSNQPHASIDFNHDPHSAIIDASQTCVDSNGLANVFVWFDNEWGFANRMIDAVQAWWPRCAQP